jgi:O-antigen ligase
MGELLLGASILVFVARLLLGRTRLRRTGVDAPILAFAVWTLLSAAFSPDPLRSHESAKKLLLLLLFYVAVDALAHPLVRERVLAALAAAGLALAAGGLLQYFWLGFDTMDRRPSSFLGHYMTASGLLMTILVFCSARLAFLDRPPALPEARDVRLAAGLVALVAAMTLLQKADLFAVEAERMAVVLLAGLAMALTLTGRDWPTPATGAWLSFLAAGLSAWALLVSRTRGAWLGALAGLGLVVLLRAPRALWLLPAAVGAVLLLGPAPVMDRLTLRDASSRDRYYMWQAGIDMIRDKPVFGQGPRMVETLYPRYRWQGAPTAQAPHLHNNALQIAAERGLPGLALWTWWMAAALAQAVRLVRGAAGRGAARAAGVASLASLVALMVAGLFEYNFGDSEVLILTLVVSALPFAAERAPEPLT